MVLDLRVDRLSQHLLLLLRRCRSERTQSEAARTSFFTARHSWLTHRSVHLTPTALWKATYLARTHRHASTAALRKSWTTGSHPTNVSHVGRHTLHVWYLTTASTTATAKGLPLVNSLGISHRVGEASRTSLHPHWHLSHTEGGRHLLATGHSAATLLWEVGGELARSTTSHTHRHARHRHTRLLCERQAATLCRVALDESRLLTRTKEHGRLHELLRHTSSGSGLLLTDVVASLDALLELVLANIFALSEGDVKRLALNHFLIHFRDRLGGLIRVAEANETETFALAQSLRFSLLRLILLLCRVLLFLVFRFLWLFIILLGILVLIRARASFARDITHHLSRSDVAVGAEDLTELVVIDVVIQIFDIQVNSLVLRSLLYTGSLILLAEIFFALMLLLSTSNVQMLAL